MKYILLCLFGLLAVACVAAFGPVIVPPTQGTPPLQRAIAGFANVADFGAAIDGVTDDTAAVNRAEDSLGAGGVLYFPPGLCKLSSLNPRVGKSIVFQGAGWSASTGAPCGDKAWSDASVQSGSRILLAATKGAGVFLPVDYPRRYVLRDLALIGTGAAGVTGVRIDYNTDVRNVLVANFDTGVATTAQACCLQVDSLDIRGCHTGLSMNTTNACVFNRLMIEWCDVRAVKMVYCSGNTFVCPAVQGNKASPQIELTDDGTAGTVGNPGDPGRQSHGCRNNRFLNTWSERGSQYAGPAWFAKFSTTSYGNTFDGLNLHSGDGDKLDVAGPNNSFLNFDYLPWGVELSLGLQATGTTWSGTTPNISGPGAGLAVKR